MDSATGIALGSLMLAVIGPPLTHVLTLRVMESRLARAELDISQATTNHALLTAALNEINTRLARIEGRLAGHVVHDDN